MIKEIIRVEIADAATEWLTKKKKYSTDGKEMESLNIIINIEYLHFYFIKCLASHKFGKIHNYIFEGFLLYLYFFNIKY
jgi:hypothetical protein